MPSTKFNPEVSLEAGTAYARQAARSGHPPYTATRPPAISGEARSPTAPWTPRCPPSPRFCAAFCA